MRHDNTCCYLGQFTKERTLDLKLRLLSLIQAKSVVLDLADFTRQQTLALAKSWAQS